MKVALLTKGGKRLVTDVHCICHDAIGAPRSKDGKLSLTLSHKIGKDDYTTEHYMVDSFLITTDEDTLLD